MEGRKVDGKEKKEENVEKGFFFFKEGNAEKGEIGRPRFHFFRIIWSFGHFCFCHFFSSSGVLVIFVIFIVSVAG